jgi:type 1 fimbriae regulatory protein FimB/type 1 fimbriae regulatory protein FimE
MPTKSNLRLVAPSNQNRTVAPGRTSNSTYRKREHLTPAEIDKLIAAAKDNRYGQRDATMILVAFRHGLRAVELCELEWSQVDWRAATLHVRRAKNGKPATHPIRGDELRELRRLHRDQEPQSSFVFASERGTPFTPDAINRLVKRLGDGDKLLGFPIHFHMLRHSCGFALANAGHDTRAIQDYLGHKAIQHTVRYTELAPTKFKAFWR